jgi:hypothetical protein
VIETLLVAAALAAAPAPILQEEPWDLPRWEEEDDDRRARVHLSVWGGEAFANGGSGRSSSYFSGEAAWIFRTTDVGVAYFGYRALRDATREWTPAVLARLTQRFPTRGGVEAAFTLGFGAARPAGWIAWFQAAIGVRVPLGPLFLGGELAFEPYDIVRLGGGLGVAF